MARWLAIVALLLGMGFTAFESFTPATERGGTVRTMEGVTPIPPTVNGGTTTPASGAVEFEIGK
jgi:hypothetical protein